ncbi:polyadenylate-binding protein, cytoplasmic and nuclear, putative [Entamoeba dispar SAW760]|uniref:Polyadenylate-binding protein, cytoplasmic and nuclear, putative n=1 Tax=Entamoeba dispar (strain ATCC PRA-260 / SAW760) TaxID=370354 RepID=B0EAE4_ENTDS|nr:polyadenylate-binding protein, cytoplasmic and nuclear, putative [Entamoeba dispar SAW760]EDR28498.1 polyadenylate-binding protein, cytoplasmic and nuclear, putative [Entamoeba dispar SAW760]|eukprot:EDR28498.1 polyadenylate-binding protein, cytoplasmic and nuclear, putative [Entamoeba dispar SAW760]
MSERHEYSYKNKYQKVREDIVERKSRILFVRNISFNANEESIRKLFEKYGEIKKVFCQIENRGIAFVTFYDIRDAIKAHEELNKKEIDGRPIKIHYSLPKDNEINKTDSLENHANLYVILRGFQKIPTNDEIFHYFEKFGEVSEIRDSADKPNIKFIEYYDSRAAVKALESSNNAQWNEGTIEVKYASFSKKDLERIVETKNQLKKLKHDHLAKDRIKDYPKYRSPGSSPKTIPPYSIYPSTYQPPYTSTYPSQYQSPYVSYQYPPQYYPLSVQIQPPNNHSSPSVPQLYPSIPPYYQQQNPATPKVLPEYSNSQKQQFVQSSPQQPSPSQTLQQTSNSSDDRKQSEPNTQPTYNPYFSSPPVQTKSEQSWKSDTNPYK